jgi:hypothetical protein
VRSRNLYSSAGVASQPHSQPQPQSHSRNVSKTLDQSEDRRSRDRDRLSNEAGPSTQRQNASSQAGIGAAEGSPPGPTAVTAENLMGGDSAPTLQQTSQHNRSPPIRNAPTSVAGVNQERVPEVSNATADRRLRTPPAEIEPEAEPEHDPHEGLSEPEVFRLITRPRDIPGLEDWGIPKAVDPDQADEGLTVSRKFTRLDFTINHVLLFCGSQMVLEMGHQRGTTPKSLRSRAEAQAKVNQFLRLKYERGQHINSTLLASSTFANPHIYAKLVSGTILLYLRPRLTLPGCDMRRITTNE